MHSQQHQRLRAEAASFRRAASCSISIIRTVKENKKLTALERYSSSQRLHWLRQQGVLTPVDIKEKLSCDIEAHAQLAALELQMLRQSRKQILFKLFNKPH